MGIRRIALGVGATVLLATQLACGSGSDGDSNGIPLPDDIPVDGENTLPPEGVGRAAVVKALTTAIDMYAAASAPDSHFSTLRNSGLSAVDQLQFRSTSYLTPFDSTYLNYDSAVGLTLSWAVGAEFITFNGSGSVAVVQGDTQVYALSAGQFSMPEDVPLDQILHRWSVEGTSHGVRFFVGSIPEKPSQMRVCWDIDVPGASRVQCTRNLRSDGSPVTIEVLHDADGAVRSHVGNDDEDAPRSVLKCEYFASGSLERRYYTLIQLVPPGGALRDYVQHFSFDPAEQSENSGYQIENVRLDGGEILHTLTPLFGRIGYSFIVAESGVVGYRRHDGSFDERCLRPEPLWRSESYGRIPLFP